MISQHWQKQNSRKKSNRLNEEKHGRSFFAVCFSVRFDESGIKNRYYGVSTTFTTIYNRCRREQNVNKKVCKFNSKR